MHHADVPPAPAPAEVEPVVDDRTYRQVLNWRIDYLMHAGYDAEAAVLLAKNFHVDLHAAGDLLIAGCAITTALLILL